MSKVLIAGDTHGNGKRVDLLIDIAMHNDCEYIYQLGDFGYWPHVPEGVEFLDSLSAALVEVGVKFIWLDGNHENHEMLALESNKVEMFGTEFYEIRPNLYWTGRTNVWVHEDVRFCVLGGAASIDKDGRVEGYDWFPGEYTTEYQAATLIEACDGLDVDIMLTHDAPDSVTSKMPLMFHHRSTYNRKVVSYAVEHIKPTTLFHGHYHHKMDHVFMDTQCHGLSWDGASIQNHTRVLSLDKVKRRRYYKDSKRPS